MSPDAQKRGKRLRMKRHQPGRNGRKRRQATKKNHTTRHELIRIGDRVVEASSKVFEGVDSDIGPNLNMLESAMSTGNPSSSSSAPKLISENDNGGHGSEDEVIVDANNMTNNTIMTDKSEMAAVAPLETSEHIYTSWHPQDDPLLCSWDGVTMEFDLGDPDYDNTLKPILGCSSEGSSPEGLLDYDWNIYHSPRRDELSVVSDDWCTLDHGDQKFMSPFQSDISDSPNSTEIWNIVEYHGNSTINSEDHQSATNIHPIDSQAHHGKRLFACPWYKKDPWKYRDCGKYELRRIKDVKQHANRKHMKPDIYCPVCFQLFKKASERDEHIQKKSCDSKPNPEFDGLTEQQRKELNQKANRGKNEAEQWYYMWDTIFPNAVRPPSPYLGDDRGELLSVLRNFWEKRGAKIISGIQALLPPKFDPQITQQIVNVIFAGLEMELSNWTSALNDHLGDSSWLNLNLPNSSNWMLDTFLGDLAQQQWNPILMPQGSSLEQQLDSGLDCTLDHMV
ncbi:hypothetical protein K449DRAFT_395933 [Hypoxylon sp. EC38]|nr:hypothetical protein K449DRAFT_395933 [Hypoxylon sp. EC38]